ncbi:MAG: DUF3500 domain-containing protein [Akkermansiaceae bacterium]
MNEQFPLNDSSLDRRHFLRQSGALAAGLVGASTIPIIGAEKKKKATSETLVKTFYDSLTEEQRKKICFNYDHPLRLKVDANWHVTKLLVEDFSKDQQAMIKEIFMKLHSEEYARIVYDQVEWDGGISGFEGGSSVAIFGTPGTGKFEFVLTGRHCTRRCDGDSDEGVAFGGPIFYGHATKGTEKADHEGNAYWYQAVQANKVYAMLDGKQRKQALLERSRGERGTKTTQLSRKKNGLEGIRVGELSGDQQGQVKKVLGDLLAPFREHDAKEALQYVEAGGLDNLHMAFYQKENIGNDEVWDNWQLEGPNVIVYFRGKPHVHAWMHIRKPV